MDLYLFCTLLISVVRSYRNRLFFRKIQETFKDIRSMPDFGVSLVWPEAPLVLRAGLEMLKTIHKYWRARMILKRYSPVEQVQP